MFDPCMILIVVSPSNITTSIEGKCVIQAMEKKIFYRIVEKIVLYGAETWPLAKMVRDSIRTVELEYIKRCLRKTRRDKLRTDEIWRQKKVSCYNTRSLKDRALQWYGHVKRIPERITEWCHVGRRRSGRLSLRKPISEMQWLKGIYVTETGTTECYGNKK